MVLSYPQQVLNLTPSQFRTAATACRALTGAVDGCADDVSRQVSMLADAWHGSDQVGGNAAVDALRARRQTLAAAADMFTAAGSTLDTLADALEHAQGTINQLFAEVKALPGTVDEQGIVKPKDPAKKAAAALITAHLKATVDSARAADQQASARLAGLVPDKIASRLPAVTIPKVPRLGTSPATVHAWWNTLTDEQRGYILAAHPEWIAGLDGIPAEYRDLANRSVLDTLIADLEGQPGSEKRLATLESIRERLLDRGKWGNDERAFLLHIDAQGDGRAIIAVGNPDTANNVFTLVPGIMNDLDNIGGNIDRVDQTVFDASQIPGSGKTSGIIWLGYDTPEHVDAVSKQDGRDGRADLDRFQDGLRATHEGPYPSRNTMIGHSYGTTMIGLAASDHNGIDTDQIIFTASPGAGVWHAEDLKIDSDGDGRPDDKAIYSSTSWNDAIHLANDLHGPQPGFNEIFGGQVFESRPNWHTGYWDPDQTAPDGARHNMALIITGNGDAITRPPWWRKLLD